MASKFWTGWSVYTQGLTDFTVISRTLSTSLLESNWVRIHLNCYDVTDSSNQMRANYPINNSVHKGLNISYFTMYIADRKISYSETYV